MATLATKYRPKNFDEVIGQELIVKILKKVIEGGIQYRAYIFSGLWDRDWETKDPTEI